MDTQQLWHTLQHSGPYSLPFLLEVQDTQKNTCLYLVNDTQDCVYNGNTYKASSFDYTPQAQGKATLTIDLVKQDTLIDLIRNSQSIQAKITGVLCQDGSVTPIKHYVHTSGTVSWDATKATITFSGDDRFGMTFPALIFNSYNNRGNT